MKRLVNLLAVLCVIQMMAANAAAQTKKPLDHDSYEIWNRVSSTVIADNGSAIALSFGPENQDPAVEVHRLDRERIATVPRGTSPQLTPNGDFAVFLVKPPRDVVRERKLAGVKGDDLPKDSLGILDTRTGLATKVPDVKSFKLSDDDSRYVAYLRTGPPGSDSTTSDSSVVRTEPMQPDSTVSKPDKNKSDGSPLTVRNLATQNERTFDHVVDYELTRDGSRVYFVRSSKDGSHDGVYELTNGTGEVREILIGTGSYTKLAVARNGDRVAFLSDRDKKEGQDETVTLYAAGTDDAAARPVATDSTGGIPDGWIVSADGDVEFSDSGERLYFGTAPRPADRDTTLKVLKDEQVVVDIWNWKDDRLQPQQLKELKDDQSRSYRAVVLLDDGRVVQLATTALPAVSIGMKGDAEVGISNSNVPYRTETSWDYPAYNDVYLVDVRTGSAKRILEQVQSGASLSPGGLYATYWDREHSTWKAYVLESGLTIDMGIGIPERLDNELHDWPYLPNPYGSAGWTSDDSAFLIYDKYDIWAVNPTVPDKPYCLTDGLGRSESTRLRYVRLDKDEQFIADNQAMLLSAQNTETKRGGFYRDREGAGRPPQRIVLTEHAYSTPTKAEHADAVYLTRESFTEFPDIWTADSDLGRLKRQTNINPQQSEYHWGTAELYSWTSSDGVPLNGLLYKPDGFDPAHKYPMMVYFYEKNSDLLYRHHAPEPHRSTINISFYVSRGYVVFVPDIVYKTGYPGESAMASVMPGVTALMDEGFVDRDRIGVQGHSWGGYQIAYMVTRTDLFRAAEAGAPVANMVSAYGGIRWGPGVSRMFQYEKTQSRIGGSLWEYPMRYLDNSPIFRIDAVQTPLLIMHNDHDAAVPWYQGIELFTAMRRLGKPAWLINYNDEPHWPTKYQNKRDWTIRMQQFFDHYLLDAPEPIWMSEGVPALDKGHTLGLDLD